LKVVRTAILVALMGLVSLAQGPAIRRNSSWEGIAIVVDRSNPLSDISSTELREILFGERQWWTHDRPITLVAMRPGTVERTTVLRSIYGMNEKAFEKFLLLKIFRGEMANPPTDSATAEDVKKAISSTTGSIGYLRASDVDNSVKVLRIDGRLPDDDGYPLRLRKRKK
jgi:ABC-type phosphate transport system substrate-binding protein